MSQGSVCTYLNPLLPLKHWHTSMICDALPLPKVSILLSPTATHCVHSTFTLHYSSSLVLDCRHSFNLISWTKSHQLLPMGPDSQGNKQEFSGLRRQQPSCGHHHPSPLFTLCLMHHVIIQTFRCNLECTEHITFVVHLQIPTEYLWYAWSTCSNMHFRLQLIISVNGNPFWATTCAHVSQVVRSTNKAT